MGIDSDCTSSIDLLSRYVDSVSKLTASRAKERFLTGEVSSNDDENSHQMPSNGKAPVDSPTEEAVNHNTISHVSSSSTLDRDCQEQEDVSPSQTLLSLHFDVCDKSTFLSKYHQISSAIKKSSFKETKLSIVQIM